eukprot:1842766-Ditylum_brightwellii.AAC.1
MGSKISMVDEDDYDDNFITMLTTWWRMLTKRESLYFLATGRYFISPYLMITRQDGSQSSGGM